MMPRDDYFSHFHLPSFSAAAHATKCLLPSMPRLFHRRHRRKLHIEHGNITRRFLISLSATRDIRRYFFISISRYRRRLLRCCRLQTFDFGPFGISMRCYLRSYYLHSHDAAAGNLFKTLLRYKFRHSHFI